MHINYCRGLHKGYIGLTLFLLRIVDMPDFDFKKYIEQRNKQKRLAQEEYETKLQENQAKNAELSHKEMKRISNLPYENQKTELQKLYKRLNDENAEKISKKRAAEERSRIMLYGPSGKIQQNPEPNNTLYVPKRTTYTVVPPTTKIPGWLDTFFPKGKVFSGGKYTLRTKKSFNNRRTLKSSTTSRKSSTRRHSRT